MGYREFTLAKAKASFGLVLDETKSLFQQVSGIQPSAILAQTLEENLALATAINSEKARSEFLIAPVLAEVRRQLNYRIGLFSGTEFSLDAAQGLTGYCNFIISASQEQYFITAPVIAVIEAKNDNIVAGLGQCAATMIAVQLFNQQDESDIKQVYGAVTTGTVWKFLALQEKRLSIDATEYYLKDEVDKILGILIKPLHHYLSALAV
ncbi:MAG: hypothetical protein AAF728_08345 [Cyanobacteria bacterium P01_D01_bin.128]